MERIAVIGANGRSGRIFVKAALDHGYAVKAGVHSTSSLPDHPHMSVVDIDATNENDIRKLLSGCDIVVSLIGHIKGSPARVQTNAITVVTRVMKELGINRIVSLTGTGVRLPGDKPSLLDYILNAPLKLVDPDRINDGIEHVKVLQESGLDWSVVRVLKLTNGEPNGFSLSAGGPGKFLVPRKEVAAAIIEVLQSDAYGQKAPVVSSANN